MDILQELEKAMVEVEEEKAIELTKKAIENGLDPVKILETSLIPGMKTVGDKFERYEYFLAELILAGEIMKACTQIIEAFMPKAADASSKTKKIIVMGTAAGDIHTIGKSLVASFLSSVGGFDVDDIGEDVSAKTFVEKARELNASIIAVSALMLSSLSEAGELVRYLEDTGLRDKFKVLMGGAAITEADAENMGADGWAPDAPGAAAVARRLVQ